jgi:hypothetical protein
MPRSFLPRSFLRRWVGEWNRPLRDNLFVALLLLSALAAFGVSPMLLAKFNIPYDTPGGSFVTKLHPATYLFGLAFLADFWRRGNLRASLLRLLRIAPGAAFFAAMWALMLVYIAMVQHTPFTAIVDSYFVSFAMILLVDGLDEEAKRLLRRLLHLFMFANACVGIIEFLTQTRLTPYVTGGKIIEHDYRSTAIMGHPLVNAGASAMYMLMLFFGADPTLPAPARVVLFLSQFLAMAPFGGRTSIVVALLLMALGLLKPLAELLAGRRFDMRYGVAAAFGLPLVVAGGAAAVASGLLDKLIERFTDDKGSAQARVAIFELFNEFSLEDLLFGPDPERLAWAQNLLGIEYGIENSWLGFVFQYGAFMSLFFVLGFFALLWEILRRSETAALIVAAHFLVQVSSSASLSVKGFMFNQFTILMLAIFARTQAACRAAPACAETRSLSPETAR